ncbi:MAG: 6-phosphofructokinase [Candidatus Margulisiibacteriota bacterium]|nr:MAG: 6-phosphofructokinase [Candidatus Margulisbacteria bacterium GWD2_39_127]PZM78985.1 MAG: 6-phosphofructokinase [Candidatus Margulisiibacteriota bacterium]HAR64422.1 6-phosphofructokinase [Candidatus Margulisiibacteriota bacterium]HCY36952.1 6-phosphofructokinase [Candidatus Margulisiibacteriota bacterium]
MTKRIGILTAGGDCPGLNAVIRAIAKKAIYCHNWEVFGFHDGLLGLIENRYTQLSEKSASGIITRGGTILGTSNKGDPFSYYKPGALEPVDVSEQTIKNVRDLGIDTLITIGGDGTQGIAYKLFKKGLPVIGIPKTIDNDLYGTDQTFGFDTAVSIATEAIDRIHTTAQAHHRIMLVEVMGRYAGWIALSSGLAGGGDIILLPEFPYNLEKIIEKIIERKNTGKTFTIVVVSEGAHEEGKGYFVRKIVKDSMEPIRLGGVSYLLAQQLEDATDSEARATVLGHVQRGGTPTAYDRILATEFGTGAVDLAQKEQFGTMVSLSNNRIVSIPLEEVASKLRLVTTDNPLIKAALDTGVSFGI